MTSYQTIFFIACLGNLAFLGTILLAQLVGVTTGRIKKRGKVIPNSFGQKYLHFQDFKVQKWGDPFGLVWLQAAFAYAVSTHGPWSGAFAIALFVSGFATWNFHKNAASNDCRHNYGNDENGHYTAAGFLHLIYFFLNVFMITAAIFYTIFGGITGWPFYWMIVGGVFYIAMFIWDLKLGNFEKRVDISTL